MAGMQIGDTEEPWAPSVNVSPPESRIPATERAVAAAGSLITGPISEAANRVQAVNQAAGVPAGVGQAAREVAGTVASAVNPFAAVPLAGKVAGAVIPPVGQAISAFFGRPPTNGAQFSQDQGSNRGRDSGTPSALGVPVHESVWERGKALPVRDYVPTVTPAAPVVPVGVARGSTMPAPMVGEGPIAGSAGQTDPMVAIRNELAQRRAAEDMGQQQKIQAMQANANWASAWTANRDAQNAARSATSRATNGADMILAPNNSGYDEQRRAIMADAVMKGGRAAGAEADLAKAQAGISGTPRNYIDEFGKLQTADKERMTGESLKTAAGARVIEANARGTEAASKSELDRAQAAGIKLSNEQHKTILELGVKLGAATNPEARRLIERQMLVTAGKDPNKFQIIKADGRKGTNAAGMPEQEPDRIFVADDQGNIKEITGGGAGGAKTPQQLDIDTLKANSGNKAIYDGFVSRFGEEAAKRVLGK